MQLNHINFFWTPFLFHFAQPIDVQESCV